MLCNWSYSFWWHFVNRLFFQCTHCIFSNSKMLIFCYENIEKYLILQQRFPWRRIQNSIFSGFFLSHQVTTTFYAVLWNPDFIDGLYSSVREKNLSATSLFHWEPMKLPLRFSKTRKKIQGITYTSKIFIK